MDVIRSKSFPQATSSNRTRVIDDHKPCPICRKPRGTTAKYHNLSEMDWHLISKHKVGVKRERIAV